MNYSDTLKTNEAIRLEKEEFTKFGFNTECCTNAYIDCSGKLWRCCNECIWHEEGGVISVRYQKPPYDRYR